MRSVVTAILQMNYGREDASETLLVVARQNIIEIRTAKQRTQKRKPRTLEHHPKGYVTRSYFSTPILRRCVQV